MSTFSSRPAAGLAVGTDVEADDDGVGGGGQSDVGLGDGATAECTMLMRTSDWSILSRESRRASMEPWTSAFTMRFSRSVLPSSMRLNKSSRFMCGSGLLGGQAGAQRALLGQLAGVALVLEHAELVAGGGDLFRPRISTGSAGRLGDVLPRGSTRARTRP